MSGPVPAATVTAAAAVEAAKAGMEYRPSDDGQTWVLIRKENKLRLRVNPRGDRTAPSSRSWSGS